MKKLGLVLVVLMTSMGMALPSRSVYSFTLDSIDGKPVPLKTYHGKVLMVVNVASKCGYTPQYAGLEKLYEKYKDRGLVIIGVPANNFAAQEPGTNEEIKKFCTNKYNVTFPMMAKVSVVGADKSPLYAYLTDKTLNPEIGGEIQWNFTKFLFSRDGKPIARFEPATGPDSPLVTAAIETAISQ